MAVRCRLTDDEPGETPKLAPVGKLTRRVPVRPTSWAPNMSGELFDELFGSLGSGLRTCFGHETASEAASTNFAALSISSGNQTIDDLTWRHLSSRVAPCPKL
jgi:hypothetical protein